VLVDSEAISARVFQEMAAGLGLEIDFETVLEQITGTSMTENLKYFSEKINGELPKDFESEFRKRSYKAFKTDLQPIKGIHGLLEKINVPVGVASSGPVEKIKLNLTTTGLIDYFGDNIFSCYEIESWKPEPEIYLHAAKQMGFEPVDCAVIEDSLPGVQAAKAGGFNVFCFASKKNKKILKELGATVFSNMEELGKLMDLD
jgi:HAD superfamily hydrolase (TIGR01509 family)